MTTSWGSRWRRRSVQVAASLWAPWASSRDLPAREAFDRLLASEVNRARRYHHSLALVIITIDGISRGVRTEPATVIRAIVEQQQGARQVDGAFQLSREMFAVLCPHAGAPQAQRTVAERLHAAILRMAENRRGAEEGQWTVSVGVASYPGDAGDDGVLLRRAQAACAATRAAGGNRVIAWHELPAAQNGRVLEEIWQQLALGDLTGLERIRAYLESGNRLGEMGERRRIGADLASRLGIPELEANALQGALLLYDLGRIGILDAIWEKPGPLTPAERRTVETHPVLGASLLKDHPPAAALVPAVLYHHERFDGTGYPDGLKGTEIPLTARVVHVVDAYLAMTRDRPFRQALGRSRALQELWRGAGTQFDPAVVEALASSVHSG